MNFLASVFFLFFHFTFPAAADLVQMQTVRPNGLCLLMSQQGGRGQGFILGNRLITAAHVIESADGEWYCIQNNELVKINSLKIGSAEIHP